MTSTGDTGLDNSDVDTLASQLLDESRMELERIDNKTLGVVGFVAVFVAVIVAGMVAGDWTPDKLSACGTPFWWAGSGAITVGVFVLASVLWPRTKKSKASLAGCVTYFGDIDEKWTSAQLLDHLTKTCEVARSRAADQLLTIAPLVMTKYRTMRLGMILVGSGLLLVCVAALL